MRPTPDQARVISHREGPLAVIAGPGSGKTAVISRRAAAMLDDGIPPERHLVLTFSRKAIDEVRRRIMVTVADPRAARRLTIENFHALGLKVIQANPQACWRDARPVIADEAEQRRIVRACAIDVGFDLRQEDRRELLKVAVRLHSLMKNEGWTAAIDKPRTIEMLAKKGIGDADSRQLLWETLWRYEQELVKGNLVDFDDLCLLPAQAMQENPDLAARMSRAYPYITVDEYQDTNYVQYLFLRAMSIERKNVVVVGDDKQGIYAFRGGRIENLKRFVRDFNAPMAQMGENFRSTGRIVQCSSNLISHNSRQMPMEARSAREVGSLPKLFREKDAEAGAAFAMKWVAHHLGRGVPATELAFIYRTNRIARMLEPALRNAGIPYDIAGGTSIFRSKELRAALGAVRLTINPADLGALTSLSEFVPGLASGGLAKIGAAMNVGAGDERSTVWGVAIGLGGRLGTALAELGARIQRLPEFGPSRLGEWMRSDIGLGLDAIYAEKISESRNRREKETEFRRICMNLAALDAGSKTALEQAAAQVAPPGASNPTAWIEHLRPEAQWECLLSAILTEPTPADSGAGSVKLTTAHRSKGLEFRHVMVVGFSDGLMPLDAAEADADDELSGGGVEEERRLAFVSVTRARDTVSFLHMDDLRPYGKPQLELSRFWQEMASPALHQHQAPSSEASYQSAHSLHT